MSRADPYERITVIKTSESDQLYDVTTYNKRLQMSLYRLHKQYPKSCKLDFFNPDTGEAHYMVKKHDVILSIYETH